MITDNIIENTKSVADLKIGDTAKIISVGDDCIDIHCHCLRLMELGFTPGQEVTVVAKSPFKDPVAVSVRGTIIALRKNEAECIKIN
ncbi:MAG TPA: FeoA family protein [Ignavibacteria bacterium]|nr:FeoA family protein [Ignavibacteria bacterium]HRF65901.1 FeoA family protein [Ignavibacteria bacterium]HRJ04211.1 FeoA family protein [Ignavibacteria bacterium]HRJ84688.1 FeoA family protein [Ignavibacteria bacterium]